jgi:hypothetical protein
MLSKSMREEKSRRNSKDAEKSHKRLQIKLDTSQYNFLPSDAQQKHEGIKIQKKLKRDG